MQSKTFQFDQKRYFIWVWKFMGDLLIFKPHFRNCYTKLKEKEKELKQNDTKSHIIIITTL